MNPRKIGAMRKDTGEDGRSRSIRRAPENHLNALDHGSSFPTICSRLVLSALVQLSSTPRMNQLSRAEKNSLGSRKESGNHRSR